MQKFRDGSTPRFEQLEDRSLMAGNVTASITGGLLELRGDNSANHLAIHQTGNNQFQVQGLGTSLKFGDKTAHSLTFKNVTSLSADLRGGGDSLTLYNSTFNAGTLGIVMGAGNDALNVSNVKALSMQFDLGDGNDVAAFVKVSATAEQGSFYALGGNGTDAMALNRVNAWELVGDVGAGNFDTLSVALCNATDAYFADYEGKNGVLSRVGNKFKTEANYGFKFVI